jgi:hypothetical protein
MIAKLMKDSGFRIAGLPPSIDDFFLNTQPKAVPFFVFGERAQSGQGFDTKSRRTPEIGTSNRCYVTIIAEAEPRPSSK